MEKKKHRFIILYALLIGIFVSCSDNITENIPFSSSGVPIQLAGSIDQENTTRANDQGFVLGDRMGIYVVDYVNGQPGQLDATNNRASNVLFTFDAETYKWSSPTTLYWRDNQTPVGYLHAAQLCIARDLFPVVLQGAVAVGDRRRRQIKDHPEANLLCVRLCPQQSPETSG